MAEALQVEKRQNLLAIEDLEMKNRLLVDKLNAQIYNQASQYKEKTLNALNRGKDGVGAGTSASPLRNSSNGRSGPGATYGGAGQNDAFARSPLQVSRVTQPSF